MKITAKEVLVQTHDTRIIKLEVAAPDISRKAKPGQFVMLMACPDGERIPLTIVNKDPQKGTVTLIFQELGLTTKLLGRLNSGDPLFALVGPLGHATEIKNYGKVILVGGGVGIAEIYPVAKALEEAGNHLEIILGSRTKGLLILEKELEGPADGFHITTDDGSCGRKGFTTDVVAELLKKDKFDLVYAVGPVPMMKRVSLVTKESGVKTIVSLNAIMVDGTGMCGCCRVDVAGKTQFSCVDGPEFDGHLVDWDGLVKRNSVYTDKEKHICKTVLQ
ncbi:MAG: sulfide/dihydroorotate dehydrogenase-like FAD/NAD-binding protein [Candidatus Omnitrophica bacterium]|nr:sulfide/dihydroorotate dehydrogenase-like FAD/NAD-binding protein [Candidatus Omnitrophota bacterium]MDD5236757.1 sulfide/dihydroorotate dehydrogenase-like FAD/NAD-binding protein [Candidatus Omnitrophota bacterium]MDD5610060.1 sulfide/dihydroorotate dehydrogenase-like FAD/NAD-binding protein [Candidatus Omnitrophota bacterium]